MSFLYSSFFLLNFLIRDKMTNDKMTKMSFEVLSQSAKTALRGSDRVASLAVE